MNKKITSGLIAGLIFGTLDILMMIPLPSENKAAAMAGAFINRFAIGFLIPVADIPTVPWIRGLIIGLLLSLPDAIITGAYIPIIGIGIAGGIIISFITIKKGK